LKFPLFRIATVNGGTAQDITLRNVNAGATIAGLPATALLFMSGRKDDLNIRGAFLHMAVYDVRPQTEAVVHLHSSYAVALSVLEETDPEDALPPITAYYVMRIGKLPMVPYFPPGNMGLADAMRPVFKDHKACLLANHGPVVADKSLRDAVGAMEELEETAKLHLMLRGIPVRTLTPQQVAELRERFPI